MSKLTCSRVLPRGARRCAGAEKLCGPVLCDEKGTSIDPNHGAGIAASRDRYHPVTRSETAFEASASVSVRLFGQPQFTMNPERARQVSVSTFFEAINSDLYPPENMEKIFGVCETTSVGKVVYNAWLTLKLRGKVSEANVTSAIAGGRLPQFFEEAIRSLGPDEQSYYSGWLTGEPCGGSGVDSWAGIGCVDGRAGRRRRRRKG